MDPGRMDGIQSLESGAVAIAGLCGMIANATILMNG